MGVTVDPLGRLLVASGALSPEGLEEILALQKDQMPLASLCHVLGIASEDALVRILSKQSGIPGVVLARSVVELTVLEGVPRDMALGSLVVPVLEDERRVFCACADANRAREALRQIAFVKGKLVVPHVALHVVLIRFIREVYEAQANGETYYLGADAGNEVVGTGQDIFVVSDVDTIPPGAMEALAVEAVAEDVTREVSGVDLDAMGDDDEPGDTTSLATSAGRSHFFPEGSEETPPPLTGVHLQPNPESGVIDLDGTDTDPQQHLSMRPSGGPPRVLVVDDDFATRNLLVKELGPEGYHVLTAGNGGEAVRIIKADPPDAVIIDVILPQIDGFQVCRSIKNSTRYRHIPVLLMSAVIDSGRVTDEVLEKYGADGYFEKPLNTHRLRDQLRSVLARAESHVQQSEDGSFERALELYRDGHVEQAMAELRQGLEVDPLSARHHFVLANLLQKQAQIYEAIDEYETTVELMPDYFPALTRLAYLYYKKGFAAKAIDTWRRALPHCPDPALRKNIEVFMRKLIADMQSQL